MSDTDSLTPLPDPVADPREIAEEQATVPRRRKPVWTKPGYWVPPVLLLGLIIGILYLVNALLGTRGYLMPQPHVIFDQSKMWTTDKMRGIEFQSPNVLLNQMSDEEREKHIEEYKAGFTINSSI